ncbi:MULTISPECIES: spore cortex biosynthesis protein YabQ [Pontibacillus]|uniref:Spore cortex biosynthesis protein YabQ n=1 Tax=Pontibacillus chungwhensis TaxID=265426 RepID=A0ABY8UX14_9BACI|nr:MULTISPECIES: spore cortex biosynthesis protein YabQ [Pontibacillus]MCD5326108.1 spore cortex biosynthesis protein YabQ [Pontibacillus sp. HN14]WIF98207.1 spore cortex biosynthesis protein YabQ [Pontibacillus chungwhensis]
MSLDTQFITMLIMFSSGVYLGMVMDTFKRFEPLWKPNVVMRYSFEILFWILQGLVLFYFLFLANQGELRLYIVLAVVCGYAAYQALFRTTYKKVLERLIKIVAGLIRFLTRLVTVFIVRPIRFLIFTIVKLILLLWTTSLAILFFLLKIILYPFQLIGRITWKLVPKNAKKYLLDVAGFYSKIKNIILKWREFIQQKRR